MWGCVQRPNISGNITLAAVTPPSDNISAAAGRLHSRQPDLFICAPGGFLPRRNVEITDGCCLMVPHADHRFFAANYSQMKVAGFEKQSRMT